ncbi:MAG: glycoside hydrolase family 13 protein, partial [Firmicutes bacterium]|nr:glycoside hydrolase family 13 protein [Candidatus Caballimonas caccae]
MVIYNPLDKFYKSTIGAVKENTLITFRLRCSCDIVDLVFYNDDGLNKKFPMQRKGDFLEVDVSLCVGLYFYYFDLRNGTFVGLNEDYLGEITYTPKSFEISVYSSDFVVPKFLNGGIIYQIFPDRFNRAEKEKKIESGKYLHEKWDETPNFLPDEKGEVLNNDFFGGDLKGIEEKLDYLKSLSVSIIYLNPIFKAYSNHRYDTADYMEIDSLLGTEEDLKRLISEADKKGIKIILDGVFNHTGSNSVYFNKDKKFNGIGAFNSKESKYYSWYNFIDYPNKYESWWGIKTLPVTNKESGFVDFITGENGVLEHYTRLGIGGWRLDVVDELPESFSKKIRSAIKKVNNEAVVIGEVWEDASNKISYGKRRKYFLGKELDSVMNYPLKNAIIEYVKEGNSKGLSRVIKEQIDHYPKQSLDILM